MKDKPNQDKVKKQQAEIIYEAANNGNGNDGNNGNGNDGDNGNGKDKDEPDGDKNGNGKGKGNTKDVEKAKNKDLSKEERNTKKENAKQGKGYRQKGKNNNRGKHLGWYKNKDKEEQQIEETYYLNDVSEDLSQVMMSYDDTGMFDTAYTYGVERIGIDILDGTRPDAQNPLYYLYDGQGSVTYVTKPDGEKRDTLTYDEFGKPRTGKLSPDGDKVLHTSFGYNGEQWDEESRLQYLRARYYEPETGRFLSRDNYEGEMESPLSKHLYAYVENNPVNRKDPSGHKMEPGTPEWFKHVKKDWTRDQVKDLQFFLNKKGFRDNKGRKLVTDGIYGDSTYQAHVKYFKSEKAKKAKKAEKKPPQKQKSKNGTNKPNPKPCITPTVALCHQMYEPKTIGEMVEYSIDSIGYAAMAYLTVIEVAAIVRASLGLWAGNNAAKLTNEFEKKGWEDVTPEEMAKNTASREYLNSNTGMKVRLDPGKPGANGFEGKDHYHIYNPKSTGKDNFYLDIDGNPVAKGSKASHILLP